MDSFNPPSGPAADRAKPRRRRSKNKSKLGLLPHWAPQSDLARVEEEPVSPKTIMRQIQPVYPEHGKIRLHQGHRLAQPEAIPTLLVARANTPHIETAPASACPSSSRFIQPVDPQQGSMGTDSYIIDCRIIDVTTYQRVNDE